MRNKLLLTIGALVLLVGGIFFTKYLLPSQEGEKSITLSITNEASGEVLLDSEEYKTDATTLSDFLKEKEEELELVYEDGQYGMFITGLKGISIEDMAAGPWWLYGYTSPEQDLKFKVGEAPAAENVNLQDGDSIKFVFTNQME